jgi:hypothetical protein
MATAVVIRSSGEVFTQDIPTEDGHTLIHEIVGGWFDCVRGEEIVGYVHDEGLLIGLPVNAVASMLFQRPLVGDCVVIGSLNEKGEYDGENHDVPVAYTSGRFFDFAKEIAEMEVIKEMLAKTISEMDFSPTITSLNEDEFGSWLEGGE